MEKRICQALSKIKCEEDEAKKVSCGIFFLFQASNPSIRLVSGPLLTELACYVKIGVKLGRGMDYGLYLQDQESPLCHAPFTLHNMK